MKDQNSYTFPNEPSRFDPRHIDELLVYSNKINASDVTIQTNSEIIAEVYGKLYKITNRALSHTEVSGIINHIYGANGTTQILRGEDIDTHYEVRPGRNQRYRHRVNGVGCFVDGKQGIQITIRTIPTVPPSIKAMNLPEHIIKAIAPPDGIIYIVGATGSGKSTLLASIIKMLAEEAESHRKILTYESPIEFVYDSIEMPTSIVSQSEIPKNLPSFAAGVRNALRRKPKLILVGESRDPETISASLEAALTGHPVYTTLHSNGVAETIRRLVGAFPIEERLGRTIDIIETVRVVIAQRLEPTVDGKRTPLREYLIFDEKIRDKILDSDPNQITATVRKLVEEFGQPMRTDIENKYKDDIISERTYKMLMTRFKHENS